MISKIISTGFPDDVFVALDGFVEQVASSGADDVIALGYLYLIQGQLERVRFRSERGYEDATRLIEEFQRAVADLAVTGRIDAQALSMVTSVLHMAGIEASAELHAGVTQFAENVLPLAVPPDFTDAMADMVAECEGDPFQLAGALAEAGHAIPAEARILRPSSKSARPMRLCGKRQSYTYSMASRRCDGPSPRSNGWSLTNALARNSPLVGQLCERLREAAGQVCISGNRASGDRHIEYLDKLLDGRSALLTQDPVLHNLAIGRGFQSFVHTPEFGLTDRRLVHVSASDKRRSRQGRHQEKRQDKWWMCRSRTRIIDVIEEPVPGVVVVTEYETIRTATPISSDREPEPDTGPEAEEQ